MSAKGIKKKQQPTTHAWTIKTKKHRPYTQCIQAVRLFDVVRLFILLFCFRLWFFVWLYTRAMGGRNLMNKNWVAGRHGLLSNVYILNLFQLCIIILYVLRSTSPFRANKDLERVMTVVVMAIRLERYRPNEGGRGTAWLKATWSQKVTKVHISNFIFWRLDLIMLI